MKNLIYFISNFSITKRRLILAFCDFFIVINSFYITKFLSNSNFQLSNDFIIIITVSSLPIFYLTGQYKSLTRYIGSQYIYSQLIRNFVFISLVLILSILIDFKIFDIKFFLLFFILLTIFISLFRVVLRDSLRIFLKEIIHTNRVAIYGAGSAGGELAAAIRSSGKKNVITFFDDNPKLWNSNLNGIPIVNPINIVNYLDKIDEILLAVPTLKIKEKRKILYNLYEYNIKVSIVPSLDEIISGKAKIDEIRSISIDDLLGRDNNSSTLSDLSTDLYKTSICVTGAGGSIGFEICKKIILQKPEKLILFDNSEYNLYRASEELFSLNSNIKIIPILGSATNRNLVSEVFRKNKVKVVIHAAAYKHVPILEDNILSCISNNVISTKILCEISRKEKIDKFIMISTDKAVRPANVMGASKRFAEQIVLSNNEEICSRIKNKEILHKTFFSVVRFGNVLDSSGSVIPLFKRQIDNGGPITLTHPEIVRYFMTIEEAASLVLHAGDLSLGGDIFLLDMGEPVKIKDLALQLIKLSGLSLKDKQNTHGDIEIVYTGLRKGEKLYEELLIEGSSIPTTHKKIFKSIEKSISPENLEPFLEELEEIVNKHDQVRAVNLLERVVPEFCKFRNRKSKLYI